MLSKQIPLGIYEKALPAGECWLERLQLAKTLGFDFVEMSVDETDERLSRLDWSREQRLALVNAIVETMCACRPCAFLLIVVSRWAVKMTRCGRRGWRLCVKLSSSPRMSVFA